MFFQERERERESGKWLIVPQGVVALTGRICSSDSEWTNTDGKSQHVFVTYEFKQMEKQHHVFKIDYVQRNVSVQIVNSSG